MRGLPYDCKPKEVAKFFDDCKIVGGDAGVFFPTNEKWGVVVDMIYFETLPLQGHGDRRGVCGAGWSEIPGKGTRAAQAKSWRKVRKARWRCARFKRRRRREKRKWEEGERPPPRRRSEH